MPDNIQLRLRLLGYEAINKGALLGRAKVRLPCRLEISDIGVFEKDGRRWVQMPAEIVRDRDGQPLKDDRGKIRYRSALRWETRDLQDGFSEALITLIEAEHGPLGGAS